MKKEILEMRHSIQMRQGLRKLCRFCNRKGSMIEIGSYIGDSTVIFASHFGSVISIDPYVSGYDQNDLASEMDNMDDVYRIFKYRIDGLSNVTHHRLTSDAFAAQNKPLVDLVYIDGVHTYEQVKRDIINYLPMVAKGGVIAGHDYSWEGVRQAVHEAIGRPHQLFVDDSWAFFV